MADKNEPAAQGIAQRLRAARERKNLSQSALSEKAGLDRKTCATIEKGGDDRDVRVSTVEKLAQVLGISPAWLAFGEDDSQQRIAGLLQELVAIKKEREAQPVRTINLWHGDEDEDEDEDAAADDEAAAGSSSGRRSEFATWPHGYRPYGRDYPALPPLGQHYAPVIHALDRLPWHRRKEIGHMLTLMVYHDEREAQRARARWLHAMLLDLVPARDQAVVDLVMQDLDSDDQLVRGRMALSLLIDGGIPVKFRDLAQARSATMPRQLYAALTCALEILVNLMDAAIADRRSAKPDRYLLPPCPVE